ncbi:MAG: hypothetical protein U0U67_00370 [Chitinophagales bacterium]
MSFKISGLFHFSKEENNSITSSQIGISIALTFLFFIGFEIIGINQIEKWKENEIAKNPVEIMVALDKVSWSKGRHLDFKYKYNGVIYKGRYRNPYLDVGDSVIVTFSAKHPTIYKVR